MKSRERLKRNPPHSIYEHLCVNIGSILYFRILKILIIAYMNICLVIVSNYKSSHFLKKGCSFTNLYIKPILYKTISAKYLLVLIYCQFKLVFQICFSLPVIN
ncbi:predicted protein [Nematostella vectensis]|uniref:Uncharacterized protein n=1 Tax=Nematostella vectensis TaxID=45351 RepID=A7STW5_NEMVE|nr:predicted protein [Nematostella vectensis]|eukprot:XP_001624942.1 predicted protein [Nematostella vectensis]